MPGKDLSDDELEDELDKAFAANETKKDNCGTAIPANKEVGLQRSNVKLKEE